jgi:hypothetical protein
MNSLKKLPIWQRFALACLICLSFAGLIGLAINFFKNGN